MAILARQGRLEDFSSQNMARFFYGHASPTTVLRTSLSEHKHISKEGKLTSP